MGNILVMITNCNTFKSNLKYLCNSIPELLNVFEDPAQRIHTIIVVTSCKLAGSSGKT